MRHHLLGLVVCVAAVPARCAAQSYLGVGADFGIVVPRGEWRQTYGQALQSGVRLEAASKGGLLLSLRGDVLFGNTLKVDPIAGLRTDVGILGDESDRARPVDVPLRARGYSIAALLGYQSVLGAHKLGWRAMAGPAYTTHKIRIQDDATLTTSNLRAEYKHGYDRLAGGFGVYGEGGMIYTQADRQVTFFLVATVSVIGSRPLRSTQFDLGAAAPGNGTDVGLGFKVGFTTALLRPGGVSEAEDIYY